MIFLGDLLKEIQTTRWHSKFRQNKNAFNSGAADGPQ